MTYAYHSLTCSCCGTGLSHEENVAKDKVPYPYDEGYGMCVSCGGDTTADTSTEEGIKKRLGWGLQTFYEARFDLVRKNLNEKNREKWDKCTYAKKVYIVMDFLEKGYIKW